MVKVLTWPDFYAHRLLYAHRSNYHGPRGRNATYIAVHTVQGSYSSCVNWFRNGSANVSAHYVVSSAGHTTQMVGENMIAWHVGAHNGYTIGIEHEGYAHDNHPPTKAMYHASAKITAGICRRHDIPVSRVIGHRDFRGATHTDPGNEWDMAYYRKLVANYMRKGTPAKPAPSKPTTLYRPRSGLFSDQFNADALAQEQKAKGFAASVEPHGRYWSVYNGAFSEMDGAKTVVNALHRAGYREAFIESVQKD